MSATSIGWSKPRKHVGILIDRCIDWKLAVDLSKIDGVTARSLEDIYGPDRNRTVPDEEFLTDAGRHGWMVWTQNPNMWFVRHERDAITNHGTHVFCLGSASLVSAGKAFTFGRWWLPIKRRHLRNDDPCFWRLYPDKTLKDSR